MRDHVSAARLDEKSNQCGRLESDLQVQLSGLECAMSEKRNRTSELEEQYKKATQACATQEDLVSQLRRQIEALTHDRDADSKDRQDRR